MPFYDVLSALRAEIDELEDPLQEDIDAALDAVIADLFEGVATAVMLSALKAARVELSSEVFIAEFGGRDPAPHSHEIGIALKAAIAALL